MKIKKKKKLHKFFGFFFRNLQSAESMDVVNTLTVENI